jgi:serine/threonine protein kinase
MNNFPGLKRFARGESSRIYEVPVHAVKIYDPATGGTEEEQEAREHEDRQKFEREAAILKQLSSADPTAQLVPEFCYADEPQLALHMEKLSGYVPLFDAFGLEVWGDRPTDAELMDIAGKLFDAAAALDRVGVAHCNINGDNVLCREDNGGELDIKLVGFGMSTTEDYEEQSDRGWWPAVQNLDMYDIRSLILRLAMGQDDPYGDTLPTFYSQDLRDMVQALGRFRRISRHFHGRGFDGKPAHQVMREDEDMWLTPRGIRRVWLRRGERGIVFGKEEKVADAKRKRAGDNQVTPAKRAKSFPR